MQGRRQVYSDHYRFLIDKLLLSIIIIHIHITHAEINSEIIQKLIDSQLDFLINLVNYD